MTHEKQRSGLKRFFSSRLFLLVCLIAAVLLAAGYARAYYQDYKIKQEILALQEEVRQLERKRLESLDILEYVKSSAFVEETARTELNLQKPGEAVLIIGGDHTSTAPTRPAATRAPGHTLTNPVKWWYYFTRRPLPDDASSYDS